MPNYNQKKFLDILEDRGVTITFLSKKSGISYKALYQKIYGLSEFKCSEAERVAGILRMSKDDVFEIFLPNLSS